MICPKCGNEIEEGVKFCGKCGAKIKKANAKEDAPSSGKPRKFVKIGILILGAAALAAVVLVLLFVFLPGASYDKAMDLAQGEQYDEAIKAFEQMNGYKDSEQMIKKMYYEKACEYMDVCEYDEAVEIFKDLDDYSNSQELMQESQNWLVYEEAKEVFNEGDFEQAKIIFVSLENFENSEQYVQDCQARLDYAEAFALFESGDYQAAKSLFDTIPDYEDSTTIALICGCRLRYDDVIEKIGKEDFESALDLLDSIEKDVVDLGIDFNLVMSKDEFNTIRNDCYKHVCYINGKGLYDQELFYSAYLEFTKASGLLDADKLAQSCVQPFETKEIYANPDYSENDVTLTFYVPHEIGKNVCVKVYSGMDLVSISLIKSGEKLTIRLPDGPYSFNKGEGVDWYGEKEYFGDEGSYYTIIFDEDLRVSKELDMMIVLFPIYKYTLTLDNQQGSAENDVIARYEF